MGSVMITSATATNRENLAADSEYAEGKPRLTWWPPVNHIHAAMPSRLQVSLDVAHIFFFNT
jgi:hypothetical protein